MGLLYALIRVDESMPDNPRIAAAIQGFTYVEWDEVTTDGLDTV